MSPVENPAIQGPAVQGPAVQVRGLKTAFGAHVVHQDLDLTVRRGEVLAIVGGSGAGKSVLVNTILGLIEPKAGDIRILGEGEGLTGEERREKVQARIGVLFQSGALFSALSVRDNVGAPLREHTGLSPATIAQLADARLAMVGLQPRAGDLAPADLSGGMRKRAGLARALALDPELLFLDEPTAGLDPLSAEAFDRLILDLKHALGLTVVMITHDLDSLYAIADRVAVVADRRIAACAPIPELERSDHPWIHAYFHGPRGRAAHSAKGDA